MLRELAPTSGLPLRWPDFIGRGQESLETLLSRRLNVPSVQIECSGTASFVVALETLKSMSSKRSVVIPGYTCPLVPIAISRAGLQAVVCDVKPDSFDFDPAKLQEVCGPDTLCVVPTHLGGLSADVETAGEIARTVGACVIEDTAQALGATRKGNALGTMGDIGFYSLAVGKGLTLYEGGALVARDAQLREALAATSRRIIPESASWEIRRTAELLGYALLYSPLGLSLSYAPELHHWLKEGQPEKAVGDVFDMDIPLHRVSNYRKQIGAAAITRFDQWLQSNVRRGRARSAQLAAISGIQVLTEAEGTVGSWPFIMVVFETQKACTSALNQLWTAGLGVTKLFVHEITGYDYLRALLPGATADNARCLANRCLTISNSEMVTDADFARICEVIEKSASVQNH